jgi:hypothetical protein
VLSLCMCYNAGGRSLLRKSWPKEKVLAAYSSAMTHRVVELLEHNGRGTLREVLLKQLNKMSDARYFTYEEDPMYTKRESELIQQYLQKYGHLRPGNQEINDLF